MNSSKVPIVAIVGRANVGKSSIFNSVLRRREAIVANEAGTTRDSIFAKASWEGKDFWLVDTAGVKDAEDDFEFTIQEQIQQAADSATIIWVVIEADHQINDEDRRLAKMALKTKKPVYLLVNKADKNTKATIENYQGLGIQTIFLTTATQNKGVADVLDQLVEDIPKKTLKQDPDRISVALLGRPNVGKSALFNVLAKKQQAIVADRAGTTRDINRIDIRYNQKTIHLMDTAGIRRSGKIQKGVEKFSVIRSISAIEQADVCLLLIDANEPATQLDQKIAGMIKEAGKGLVLVVSKWDSLEKDAFTRDELAPRIKHEFAFTPWAPLVFTSSVTGQNVTKLFDLITEIANNRTHTIKTPELNRWLKKAVSLHPPAGLKNTNPRLRYIMQEQDNPTNFKIFGSQTRMVHWSYRRYLDRKLREDYGFEGTPLKFWFFDKKAPEKEKAVE